MKLIDIDGIQKHTMKLGSIEIDVYYAKEIDNALEVDCNKPQSIKGYKLEKIEKLVDDFEKWSSNEENNLTDEFIPIWWLENWFMDNYNAWTDLSELWHKEIKEYD